MASGLCIAASHACLHSEVHDVQTSCLFILVHATHTCNIVQAKPAILTSCVKHLLLLQVSQETSWAVVDPLVLADPQDPQDRGGWWDEEQQHCSGASEWSSQRCSPTGTLTCREYGQVISQQSMSNNACLHQSNIHRPQAARPKVQTAHRQEVGPVNCC